MSNAFSAPHTATRRPLTIDGTVFELSLAAQEDARSWHWMIAAPGKMVLSGEAASETQAYDSACRAGRALAELA